MSIEKGFFGHPKGLSTLFFTEMWERFSYYGMRAILLLFMVEKIEAGGLGLDDRTGNAVYGLYTMLVYLLALPGGWLADRFFGLRKAVFYGGCLIAIGHLFLAISSTETFFIGLLFIVLGTGLLKPNISSLVGELYPQDDQARRDAGFSIFYSGINIGAWISPLIVGYLGENVNWHYGFGAAALGMIVGLIQYKLTEKNLGEVGITPSANGDVSKQQIFDKKVKIGLIVFVLVLAGFVMLLALRIISVNPIRVAQLSTYIIAIALICYFGSVLFFGKLSLDEKKKIIVIGILFVFSCMFWAGYEQQGSSLNLFAKRYTDRFILGWEMPASWLQSAPPIFVIIFSPLFAWLWITLQKKNLNPSTPLKFSLGLIFMALGFLIMVGASQIVVGGEKPLSTWLIFTYLFHTFGEICLYPVGLSAVTKLSPKKLVGQMMGIWFMSLAFGNLVAGIFAGEFDEKAVATNPSLLIDLFWLVVKVTGISGLLILILSKPIKKLMGTIH